MLGQHKANNSSKDLKDQHEEELHTSNEESSEERCILFSDESGPKVFQELDIVFENPTQYISTQEDHRVDEEVTENSKDLGLVTMSEEIDIIATLSRQLVAQGILNEDTQHEVHRRLLKDFLQESDTIFHSKSPLEAIDPYKKQSQETELADTEDINCFAPESHPVTHKDIQK